MGSIEENELFWREKGFRRQKNLFRRKKLALGDWSYRFEDPSVEKMNDEDAYERIVLLCVACNSSSQKTLWELARDPNIYIRQNVAFNENTGQDILNYLSKDENGVVQRCVAWNKNAPAEALVFLSEHENHYVRCDVASHHSTPPETIEKLLRTAINFPTDETTQQINPIARNVAINPSTPEMILRELSKTKISTVRQSLASNPNCPKDILDNLSMDVQDYVRLQVAKNPNTNFETLARLASDENNDVREFIFEKHPEKKSQFIEKNPILKNRQNILNRYLTDNNTHGEDK